MYLVGLFGEILGAAFFSLVNPIAWIAAIWMLIKKYETTDIRFHITVINAVCWLAVSVIVKNTESVTAKMFIAAAIGGFFIALICCSMRWLYRKLSDFLPNTNSQLYEAAIQEIESGSVIKGLWARALVSANGDESKARAKYIKFRVDDLNRLKNK